MPKRKAFIDKKHSVAFRLVHRSQRDPLVAAEGRGLVLDPVDGVEKLRITENNTKESAGAESTDGKNPQDPLKRKAEQIKYGIYFEDDYDYLRHLKDANEVYSLEGLEERFRIEKDDGRPIDAGRDLVLPKAKLELPSSLFESKNFELKTGLLNQAAPLPGPHPELDPDIVAALDDDNYNFNDPDNQLDDDFIFKANAPSSSGLDDPDERDDESDHHVANKFMQIRDHSDEYDTDHSDVASLNDDLYDMFDREETRSRFTAYSLTSSVMRRSEGLKTVDAVFEKLYEQYDEDELGELVNEDHEIAGFIKPESDRMLQLIKDYEKETNKEKVLAEELFNEKEENLHNDTTEDDKEEEKLVKVVLDDNRKDRWDCESILSTYSTLYNHPTVISNEPRRKRARLRLDPKTGLPAGVLKSSDLGSTLAKLNDHVMAEDCYDDDGDDQMTVRTKASTIRSKNETSEDRRNRKSLVKLERRERRQEKKMNKVAFKSEELRRNKVQLNVQQNLSGIRLC